MFRHRKMNNPREITIKPGEVIVIRQEIEKEWFTISEFAEFAKIPKSTIYRKIKSGKIEVDKSQKIIRINRNQK